MPGLQDITDLPDMLGEIGPRVKDSSYVPALEKVSDDLEQQHDRMFQEGRAADGTAWAPLKQRTIKKKGHGIILVEFEDLMESLAGKTSDSIREIHEQELTFGTSDRKAQFHQDGTKFMPARPPVGISDETLDKAAEHVADHALNLALEVIDQWLH